VSDGFGPLILRPKTRIAGVGNFPRFLFLRHLFKLDSWWVGPGGGHAPQAGLNRLVGAWMGYQIRRSRRNGFQARQIRRGGRRSFRGRRRGARRASRGVRRSMYRSRGFRSRRRRFGSRRSSRRFGGSKRGRSAIASYDLDGAAKWTVGRATQMPKYSRAYKNVLSSPQKLCNNATFTVASSSSGNCSWHIFGGFVTGILDSIQQLAQGLSIGAAYDTRFKVFLQRWSQRYICKNSMSQRAECDLWLLYPRRDYAPVGEFKTFLGTDNPSLLLQGAVDVPQMGAAAAFPPINMLNYNASPYLSPPLCSAFKVKKLGKTFVEPGGQFEIIQNIPKAFVYSASSFGCDSKQPFITDQFSILKKTGPVIMLRIRGTLIHDESKTVGGTGPSTVVSTSSFGLDCMRESRFTYCAMRAQEPRRNILQNSLQIVALSDQQAYSTRTTTDVASLF